MGLFNRLLMYSSRLNLNFPHMMRSLYRCSFKVDFIRNTIYYIPPYIGISEDILQIYADCDL